MIVGANLSHCLLTLFELAIQVERSKPKCAKYWPDLDKSESFGKFEIKNVSETLNTDYTLREFLVNKEGKDERKIFHFHFQVGTHSDTFKKKLKKLTFF